MSGEEHGSTKAAPVVAANADQNEPTALRRLVGEEEASKGETGEREDDGSELSSVPASKKDSDSEEEDEEEEESDDGRPNFRRAAVDAEALKSDREWFNRGKNVRDDDIFGKPGKLGGALASVFSAAASKSQEGGTALTLSSAAQLGSKEQSKGGSEGGGEEMDIVAEEEWLEGANDNMDEGGQSPTPPRFGTPTPSQKRPPVPRPVTPSKGRKRMAVGTPAQVRRVGPPRNSNLGWSAVAQLQETIASLEGRLNGKMATLAIGWEAAEARLSEKLAKIQEGMETAEARAQGRAEVFGEKLEEIKKGIIAREDWEEQQWGALGLQMREEEGEMKEIKQGIDSLIQGKNERRKREKKEAAEAKERAAPPPTVPASTPVEPRAPRAPPKMPSPARTALAPALPRIPEVVMRDEEEEDPIEEVSDMEGVQREGLFDSQYAPEAGEPDYMVVAAEKGKSEEALRNAAQKKRKKAARTEEKKTKEKEKGKEKEVITRVEGKGTEANSVPVAPRAILK
jgi:hypothetical protein